MAKAHASNQCGRASNPGISGIRDSGFGIRVEYTAGFALLKGHFFSTFSSCFPGSLLVEYLHKNPVFQLSFLHKGS